MNKSLDKAWIERSTSLLVLMVAVISSWGLISIWDADVYARGGRILFIFWMIPLMRVLYIQRWTGKLKADFALLAFALMCAMVGWLGSLNIAKHLALGFAVGGQVRAQPYKYLWLMGMLCWLPATGWLAQGIPGNGWPLRVGILIVSILASWKWWQGGRT